MFVGYLCFSLPLGETRGPSSGILWLQSLHELHAAETPASFVFEGLLEFLTSNAQEAKVLGKP